MLLKCVLVYGYWPMWIAEQLLIFLYNLKYLQTISMNIGIHTNTIESR